jgi:hypothetical protein
MEMKAVDKMAENFLIRCIDTGLSTCWGLNMEPSNLNRAFGKYCLIFKLNEGLEDFSKAET